MSQLARIGRIRKDEPLLEVILAHVNGKFRAHDINGLVEAQSFSNIVHALAKMGMLPQHTSSANQVMAIPGEGTSELVAETGNIASCLWR